MLMVQLFGMKNQRTFELKIDMIVLKGHISTEVADASRVSQS